MTNITIIGASFGALTAIRHLRKHRVKANITVISPHDSLIYYPSLIWFPSGFRRAEDLIVPLASFFKKHGVTWVNGTVTKVSEDGRTVYCGDQSYSNDYLIIASGGCYIKKLPGIETTLIPCEGIAAAETITGRLKAMSGGTIAIGFSTNTNEPGAVRGGPMFEFLFGIDTLLRRQKRRKKFELVFFNPSLEPGQRLGKAAVSGLLKHMKSRRIKTHLGHKIVGFEPNKVITEGGEINADLILFMPGLTGPNWVQNSDLPRSEGGFIKADDACRVEGLSHTYVVGDAGSYPGPEWMAKQAHQADLQAACAAQNIANSLKGSQKRVGFKSELVCIVDTLDAGILVFRDEKRNFVLPRLGLFHWLKVQFEHYYLKSYR